MSGFFRMIFIAVRQPLKPPPMMAIVNGLLDVVALIVISDFLRSISAMTNPIIFDADEPSQCAGQCDVHQTYRSASTAVNWK
jgi:hypothetical protein